MEEDGEEEGDVRRERQGENDGEREEWRNKTERNCGYLAEDEDNEADVKRRRRETNADEGVKEEEEEKEGWLVENDERETEPYIFRLPNTDSTLGGATVIPSRMLRKLSVFKCCSRPSVFLKSTKGYKRRI